MSFIQPRIYTHYKNVVCQDMIYTSAIKNIMQLPQITKCKLNASSPKQNNKQNGLAAQSALQCIAGQKSKQTRAHKSIAAFQIRKNNLLGCAVTLRGYMLYSFLDQYLLCVCPNALTTFGMSIYDSSFNSTNITKGVNVPAARVDKRRKGQYKQHDISKQQPHHFLVPSVLPRCTINYTIGGDSFLSFPGLQSHLLAFLNIGGYNCTFSAVVTHYPLFIPLITAFTIPVRNTNIK